MTNAAKMMMMSEKERSKENGELGENQKQTMPKRFEAQIQIKPAPKKKKQE